MIARSSPWLVELVRERPAAALSENDEAGVAIIGGGISGLSVAQQVLERTDKDVLLLEKGLVANGATGHNGGQVVAAFEQRYATLVERFGEERVTTAFREVGGAWAILESALRTMGRADLLQEVPGQIGLSRAEELSDWVEEIKVRRKLGMPAGPLRISSDVRAAPPVGEEIELAYRDEIEGLLWSKDHRYLAAAEMRVGTINSAILTEALARHLLEAYPERFKVFERSPVDLIRLSDEEATIRSNGRIVVADQAVLCTNGYAVPRFEACAPPAVIRHVQGVVGYMAGAISPVGAPGARAYFRGGDGAPYYYLTRRRYGDGWLTSVGGPENPLQSGEYDPGTDYDPEAFERIAAFVRSTLMDDIGPLSMRWQGLMGYTSTNVRLVGRDPQHPALFYNLGCNGIGLLSAVAGARRTSELMNGEDLPPSMFDPDVLGGGKRRMEPQRTR